MQHESGFTEVSREVAAPALLEVVGCALRELHAGAPGLPTVTLASTLDGDLGFDSLARTELLLRTERAFGIRLPDDTLQRAETVGSLLVAAQHAQRVSEREDIGAARPSQREPAPAATRPPEPAVDGVTPASARTLLDVLQWHLQSNADAPT